MVVPFSSATANNIFQDDVFKLSFFLSMAHGCIGTAVIVVNNLRDRITDVEAGKLTMAVRFGETFARLEYLTLILIAYGMLPLIAFSDRPFCTEWIMLPLLSFPLAIPPTNSSRFPKKRRSRSKPKSRGDCEGSIPILHPVGNRLAFWLMKFASSRLKPKGHQKVCFPQLYNTKWNKQLERFEISICDIIIHSYVSCLIKKSCY